MVVNVFFRKHGVKAETTRGALARILLQDIACNTFANYAMTQMQHREIMTASSVQFISVFLLSIVFFICRYNYKERISRRGTLPSDSGPSSMDQLPSALVLFLYLQLKFGCDFCYGCHGYCNHSANYNNLSF